MKKSEARLTQLKTELGLPANASDDDLLNSLRELHNSSDNNRFKLVQYELGITQRELRSLNNRVTRLERKRLHCNFMQEIRARDNPWKRSLSDYEHFRRQIAEKLSLEPEITDDQEIFIQVVLANCIMVD